MGIIAVSTYQLANRKCSSGIVLTLSRVPLQDDEGITNFFRELHRKEAKKKPTGVREKLLPT